MPLNTNIIIVPRDSILTPRQQVPALTIECHVSFSCFVLGLFVAAVIFVLLGGFGLGFGLFVCVFFCFWSLL